METDRNEAVVTSSPTGGTRRCLLTLLASVPLVGTLSVLEAEEGAAKRRRPHARRHHRKHKKHHHKHHHQGNRKPTKHLKVVSVRMSFTGSQLIPSGTATRIQFNAIDADTNPSSVNLATSQFTAPFAGIYLVDAQVAWNGMTGGQRQAQLVKNATTVVAVGEGIPAGGGFISAPSTTVTLGAGETLAVFGLQSSGAPVEVPSAFLSILLQRRT
jgi:hypothetical protein